MNAHAAAQFGYDPYSSHPDTAGLFSSIKKGISSAAKGVVKLASAPERLAVSVASKAGIPGAKYAVMAVAPGLAATSQGGQVAAATLNTIANPNWKNLVNNAQLALKSAGPAGLVASGALGAMQAGLSGKNLESIAWAAAQGAAPQGIDTAIRAAEALRHGQSVLTVALNAAAQSFNPGTPEMFGFNAAIDTLKKAANKAALGVARNALPGEGARRAFDAAVGVMAQGALKAPSLSNLVQRAGSLPIISLGKAKAALSAIPSATQDVMNAIQRNPTMLAGNRQLIAQAMRTNSATVNDAMALVTNRGKNLLPWRSMAPNVVSFIRRYAPNAPMSALRHNHTDIGGLSSTGTTYIVEKGQGPFAITEAILGKGTGNRWKELLAYNKDKKPTLDKNVWVGEVINLPPSWQKPVVSVNPPAAALPAQPSIVPTIAPVTDVVGAATQAANNVIPGVLQAKAILTAWGKTDGINQAGLSDYGSNAADLSTSMGPRDTMMLASFQNWDNKTLNAGLNTTGTLDERTLQELQSWATARATAALPVAIPTVSTPALPAVSIPSVDPLPVVVSGGVVGGTAGNPAAPQVATAAKPASGGSGGMIAGGAIIGGLLFGVPGALVGAAAGAAIS